MFKHATISRTSRAQQTLQLQRQWQQLQLSHQHQDEEPFVPFNQQDLNNNNNNSSHNNGNTHSGSPSPSVQTVSATSSPLKSVRSASSLGRSPITGSPRCGGDSMIKIFAQSLSQEVEYVTLHVDAQTKSQQIIKSLLRKFRLKHRDPNLFYLTLERWIRKDGLKFRSVMLLGDEACPLQLQQCCSNPPHNDIKFTLQMRTGALVKIFCSDVAPETRYKCVSLSSQTTVDETIELMLHCLNLTSSPGNQSDHQAATQTTCRELAGSPHSIGSSSSNSSSSGIESEPTNTSPRALNKSNCSKSNSRASSITSISSASNLSNSSNNQAVEQYCLVIECKDSKFKRILESDEYLVDVYQNLLAEQQQLPLTVSTTNDSPFNDVTCGNDPTRLASHKANEPAKQSHDQWFFIKLKRRNAFDCASATNAVKFTSPRQNMPLPPIPLSSLAQFHQHHQLVSTTQIELHTGRPGSSLASCSSSPVAQLAPSGQSEEPKQRMPPPPAIICLPPIRPRRRNLSNASSTFTASTLTRPSAHSSSFSTLSRRRYDPAQLAEDLSNLDVKESQ